MNVIFAFRPTRGDYLGGKAGAYKNCRVYFAQPSSGAHPRSPRRRKAVHQRQPIQAFAESARKIVDPALAAQTAPQSDLLHCHAQNQNLVHQSRPIRTEFAFGAVQPQHRLALAFRNRLAKLAAVMNRVADISKLSA